MLQADEKVEHVEQTVFWQSAPLFSPESPSPFLSLFASFICFLSVRSGVDSVGLGNGRLPRRCHLFQQSDRFELSLLKRIFYSELAHMFRLSDRCLISRDDARIPYPPLGQHLRILPQQTKVDSISISRMMSLPRSSALPLASSLSPIAVCLSNLASERAGLSNTNISARSNRRRIIFTCVKPTTNRVC